jgi:2-desacetyl-2-hydroxyethyl bacteriochlorophyllide A dehydrogenase
MPVTVSGFLAGYPGKTWIHGTVLKMGHLRSPPETFMNRAHARAFWIREPGVGEIREHALAPAADGQVLVETLYSGISRGTEALVFNGQVPESEYQRMRAPFQEGDFPGPLKYGYASVGRVVEGPESLLHRHVFCLFPHQDCYRVDAGDVVPIPEEVPPARAVLSANMETAVNAVWDARPAAGDRISVVGAGTLGCLLARLTSRFPGTQVELVDVNPARATVADALGVDFATPADAQENRDLVFHTSASGSGLDTALSLAGFEARVMEMSWYGAKPVTSHLGVHFHSRRITLQSSQVGTIATPRRERRSTTERMILALEFLADPCLDSLITGDDSFDALPQVMSRLARGAGDTICHRIVYG